MGDHGGIIVLVSDQIATNQVIYSLDEGLSFQTIQFTLKPMEVTNIVIEPSNTGRHFILYGDYIRDKDKSRIG